MLDRQETIYEVVTLLDVDGTISNTAKHMAGFNERLANAFPVVAGHLDDLVAARIAFRQEYADLPHAAQARIWEEQNPGSSFDSQLGFYFGTLPEVFTPELQREIRDWSRNPGNFGSAEYPDVPAMMEGLHGIGCGVGESAVALYTVGNHTTFETQPDGQKIVAPGWQTLKITSSPAMRDMPFHIANTLPPGGKAEVVASWYQDEEERFRIPLTNDPAAAILARRVLLVDDSIHNVLGSNRVTSALIDRAGKHRGLDLLGLHKVHVLPSLWDVPMLARRLAA